MEIYIVVYSLVFVMMFFDCDRISRRTKKLILVYISFILVAFNGLRWETGTDWSQYYNIFQFSDWNNIFSFTRYSNGDSQVEFGFVFVNTLLKSLGLGSYTFYLTITNAIRFWIISYLVLKYCKYPIVAFCVYVSLNYFFPTRNPFAIIICFSAIPFILERRLVPFALVTFIASTIHLSAVVFFGVYFLYNIRLKTPYLFLLYFLSVSISMLISKLMGDLIPLFALLGNTAENMSETYTQIGLDDQWATMRSIPTHVLALFWVSVFSLGVSRLKGEEKNRYQFFLLCYVLSLCMYNLFSATLPHLGRFALFIDYSFLLMPLFIARFRKFRVVIIFFLIAFFYYRLNSMIFVGKWPEAFIPYKTMFD